MKQTQKKDMKGFTLIELMVSLGIFAVVGVILTEVFITSIRSSIRGEVSHTVKQNGDMALGVITRMVQNAQKITSDCSGTTDTSMTLTNQDGGVSTFQCEKDGAILRIASVSGATTSYLTSPEVTLTGTVCDDIPLFTCSLSGNASPVVKISFSLKEYSVAPTPANPVSGLFETTVNLRNE